MPAASLPAPQYAIRKPHSRGATWVWLAAMLTLGFGLPMMVGQQDLQPPAAQEAWLEILTTCASALGRALQHSLVLISWVLVTALLSAPGFFLRSAKVQRLHTIGAALAIVTFAALTASLQLARHKPAPSISSQSDSSGSVANRTPEQRR